MKKAADDNELIRQIAGGDTSLFRILAEKYKDVALSLAISIMKNKEMAEDVTQDAFLKAFLNLRNFNFNASFSTWLYRIVVNTCYNALEKNKVRKASPLDGQEVMALRAKSENPVQEEDRKEIIRIVLEKMRPQEALLLRLYYLGEQSIHEIKDITGMSQSNIKVTLHRARKSFHEDLEKMLGDEKEHLL